MAIVALKNLFVWIAGQLGVLAPGVRDARPARRRLPAPPAAAARLVPAHEDRPDHLARALRYRADEAAHHRDGHVGDPEPRPIVVTIASLEISRRLTLIALVVAPVLIAALRPLRQAAQALRRLQTTTAR